MCKHLRRLRSSIRSARIVIATVKFYEHEVGRFQALGCGFDRIANFGCGSGFETFALNCLLNAKEAVGIDKNLNSIAGARDMVQGFFQDLKNINYALHQHQDIPEPLQSEAETILANYWGRAWPSFEVADFTKATCLPADSFDLVYCERTLYHIACDGVEPARNNALCAIKEMARVAKLGGLVAAVEPKTCSPDDGRPLQLAPLFLQAGLAELEVNKTTFLLEDRNTYLYSKVD